MKRTAPEHGRGARLGDRAAWVSAASSAVLDLVNDELAVPHPELEARLSGEGVATDDGRRVHFDSHILTEAVSALRDLHALQTTSNTTKGNRKVDLLTPADTRGRTTAISQAVRRKGMLYSRFRVLADTAGEAGEHVLRTSLLRAGPHLTPVTPGFKETRAIGKARFYGALDSAAWLTTMDADTGLPRPHVAVPMEMKNRRLVIYPLHKEVHQLLSKAATLQRTHPEVPVIPVLICRAAHARVFWMAKDLGFRVHVTKRQFVSLPNRMEPRLFDQVRSELHLSDLTLVTRDNTPTIREFFEKTITSTAGTSPERWAITAPVVGPFAEVLRKDNVTPAVRQQRLRELRQAIQERFREVGITEELRSWSLPDEENEEYEEPFE